MRLSKRLETVVSFVGTKSKAADVGTDHGYVPIALVERGIAVQAVAMDVREGPLRRAAEHIRQHGLEALIDVRLSDGVRRLKEGEADTVIVAGMGGELVIHILEDGKRLWGEVDHWILSPQSEIGKVRRFLWENGFGIEREEMVAEDGKYYTVMDVVFGRTEKLEAWELLYGPCLIKRKHPVLREFLLKERQVLAGLLKGLEGREGESAKQRAAELRQKAQWADKALAIMDSFAGIQTNPDMEI